MTWVYLIVGIVCLVALQLLRTVLAMVFPLRDIRPCGRPEPRQFGGLELIEETTSALKELGFDGPAWLCDEERQTDSEYSNIHAVYRNVEKNTVAWAGPTQEVAQPEQLLFFYTTALDDGRFAVTQVSDPYFSAVADPKTPAQTIAASDKTTELDQHLEFVQSLGTPPIANVPIRESVMAFAGEHMNSIRERLLERGKLRESDGIARPGFAFAIEILRRFATRPARSATESKDIPTARLAFLARVARRASERAPAQPMQWFLMLLSAVLFLAIGWPLFGLEYTAIILAVILLHEGGHWGAMKAFGYRNPHITLLPLLGGVTIGHETDPGAAKRLWVSLAGPLPGIILGWAMIIFISAEANIDLYSQWILPTIIVLLFVNYLNVLPIPPLDGSHVVKALLPPKWVFVQIIAVFMGVAIGAYVAYLLDFWPLALIAAMQLLAVKNLWQDAKLVRHFNRDRPPETDDEDAKTEWLLEKLNELIGAPKKAAKRIALARDILSQIDMRPMGALHRTAASIVYLSLVAVPVSAIAFSALDPFSMEISPEETAMYEELDLGQIQLAGEAESMSIIAIANDLSEPGENIVQASEDEVLSEEVRLGRALPGHLRDFYLQVNGLNALGLSSVDAIRPVDPNLFISGELQYSAYEGQFIFYNDDYEEIVVPVEATSGWLQLGHTAELASHLFVDPDAAPGETAIFSFSFEDISAYTDLAAMLREVWVMEKSTAVYAALSQKMYDQAANRMKDLSVEELLKEFRQPGLIERLVLGADAVAGPAEQSAIRDTEARIGRTLPDDHKRVLAVHNGFAPMALLPVEEIQSANESVDYSLESAIELTNSAIENGSVLTMDELTACWVIAGFVSDDFDDAGANRLHGHIYWCPEMEAARQYISPSYGGYHPTLTSVMRQSAARMNSGY